MRNTATLVGLVLLASSVHCNKEDPVQPDLAVDLQLMPDTVGVNEPFGRACTTIGKECPDKDPAGFTLVCIALAGGSAGKGFCTRSCTDVGTECEGAPNGQKAGCFISSGAGDAGPGDKFCGFLCKTKTNFWTCPGTLTCGKPDKDGTAVCLP
ncbi:MAG: hypothetical protein ACOY3Y_08655 [Acidobacteriota bacterium]